MTFGEKLAALTAHRRIAKSTASVQAGLPANAISDYISKKYIPRADTALKLARVLGVTLDYLFDESQGFPPPDDLATDVLSQASNERLMLEVAKRYRLEFLDVLDVMSAAETVDAADVRAELARWKPGDTIPPQTMKVAGALMRYRELKKKWMVDEFSIEHHDQLPGKNLGPEVFVKPMLQLERGEWNDELISQVLNFINTGLRMHTLSRMAELLESMQKRLAAD